MDEAPQLQHEPAAAARGYSAPEMRAVDGRGFAVHRDFEELMLGVSSGLHEHGTGGNRAGIDESDSDFFRAELVNQRRDVLGKARPLAGRIEIAQLAEEQRAVIF